MDLPITAFKGIWDRLSYFQQPVLAKTCIEFQRKAKRLPWKIPDMSIFRHGLIKDSYTLIEMSPNLEKKKNHDGDTYEWVWEYLGNKIVVTLRTVTIIPAEVKNIKATNTQMIVNRQPSRVIFYVSNIFIHYSGKTVTGMLMKAFHKPKGIRDCVCPRYPELSPLVDPLIPSDAIWIKLEDELTQAVEHPIVEPFFFKTCSCFDNGTFPKTLFIPTNGWCATPKCRRCFMKPKKVGHFWH